MAPKRKPRKIHRTINTLKLVFRPSIGKNTIHTPITNIMDFFRPTLSIIKPENIPPNTEVSSAPPRRIVFNLSGTPNTF